MVLTLTSLSSAAQELSRPPGGFRWQRLPEIQGAVLLPDGWRYVRDRTGQGWGYKIVEAGGREPASLELRLLLGGGGAGDPAKLASDFFDRVTAELRAERTWDGSKDGYVTRSGYFVEDRRADSPQKAFVQVLVDRKTHTLVLMTFSSGARDWPAKWKIGEIVCAELVLPDEKALDYLRRP